MITVIFHDASLHRRPLAEHTDAAIEAARQQVEEITGKELALDWRTDFPSFTVYDAEGEEIGEG